MRNTADSNKISYNGELMAMLLKYYFHFSMFQKGNDKGYSTVLLYFINTFRNFTVLKLRQLCLKILFTVTSAIFKEEYSSPT